LCVHPAVERAQTGRVGEQILIVAKRGGILRVDGELPVVEGAGDAVGAGIENGYRRKILWRHTGIDSGEAVFLVAPEKVDRGQRGKRQRHLRAQVPFVRVRAPQRGRNRRVRPAEARQQRALLARLKPAIAIQIVPLIHISAQAVGVAVIEIAAGQRRVHATKRPAHCQATGMWHLPGKASARRYAVPRDQVRLRRELPRRRVIAEGAGLRRDAATREVRKHTQIEREPARGIHPVGSPGRCGCDAFA
jgi:hypothetical protein